LELREINEVSHALRKVFHLSYFLGFIKFALWEVVVKIEKAPEGYAGPHISPIDQCLHV